MKVLFHFARISLYTQTSNNMYYMYYIFQGDICKWRISATNGEKIILNVTHLDIPASHGCHSDFLEIRDGYWHRSELLVRLCGNLIPNEPIISSGSRLLLTYKTSEHSPIHTGFVAAYEGKYYISFG